MCLTTEGEERLLQWHLHNRGIPLPWNYCRWAFASSNIVTFRVYRLCATSDVWAWSVIHRCTSYMLKATALLHFPCNCLGLFSVMVTCYNLARVRFMVLLVCWFSLVGCVAVLEGFVFVGAAAPCLAGDHLPQGRRRLYVHSYGNAYIECRIWGSRSDGYGDCCLLGHNVIYSVEG